jgi:UDP-glucose 4-epimerase
LQRDTEWKEVKVLVTGGASFIGSHLVDKLVAKGAIVTVIDNLSSGNMKNLSEVSHKIKFVKKDLEFMTLEESKTIFKDQERVFHLAAVHGGRGFITNHPADVCSNLAIDHHVLEASLNANIENMVFASTACVYPTRLQEEIGSDYKLKEEDSNPFNLDDNLSADIEYGWGKLMSEIQMISFKKQYGLKGCPVRFVTAYGPRENETHAIIALIYKGIERMDPFKVWGNGQQERDFTYVEDIVSGTILASEKIYDCTPINLGTGKKYTINQVIEMIFKIMKWRPKEIDYDLSKPVGALSRALDNSRAKKLIGWEPKFDLEQGLTNTIRWYADSHHVNGTVNEEMLVNHVT